MISNCCPRATGFCWWNLEPTPLKRHNVKHQHLLTPAKSLTRNQAPNYLMKHGRPKNSGRYAKPDSVRPPMYRACPRHTQGGKTPPYHPKRSAITCATSASCLMFTTTTPHSTDTSGRAEYTAGSPSPWTPPKEWPTGVNF